MSESGGFRLDCAKGHEAAEGCAAAAAAAATVPREGGLPRAERGQLLTQWPRLRSKEKRTTTRREGK